MKLYRGSHQLHEEVSIGAYVLTEFQEQEALWRRQVSFPRAHSPVPNSAINPTFSTLFSGPTHFGWQEMFPSNYYFDVEKTAVTLNRIGILTGVLPFFKKTNKQKKDCDKEHKWISLAVVVTWNNFGWHPHSAKQTASAGCLTLWSLDVFLLCYTTEFTAFRTLLCLKVGWFMICLTVTHFTSRGTKFLHSTNNLLQL